MKEIKVTFLPGGATVTVPAGESLLNAAVAAGVPLWAPCGGHGRCGKCRVQVRSGQCQPPEEAEQKHISPLELQEGWRLACQAQALTDLEVLVPAEQQAIVRKPLEDELIEGVVLNPAVRQWRIQLPPPTLQDQRADFARLRESLPEKLCASQAALPALQALPSALRQNQFEVIATVLEDKLVSVALPASARAPLGVAVDIGTTTVVAYLVDLSTGKHLATGMAHNPQAQHGADVISRTEYAARHPEGLKRLQQEAIGVVNQVVAQALESVGARDVDIYEMTVVGNTFMLHLFLGLDPQYIAQAPYIPVHSDPYIVAPTELGVKINPSGRIFCLPIIAGYIGADTVGMIAATRLLENEKPVLAVDIGTNGEVALWSGQRLVCASCAAGPAFEGAQIEQGMRAAPGAISGVVLKNGDIQIETIGQEPPVGICGSGLFDAMAVCLEAGIVDAMGRMIPPDEEKKLPSALADRLCGENNTRRFRLAPEAAGKCSPGVYLTQKDVRELQLAKGAVRAAVEMLLKECGLGVQDLSAVLLAGAFGNVIRPTSALRIGLLPPMDPALIRGVGNAAGAGAMLALINLEWREKSCEIAQRAEHIELSQRPEFQQLFMETMLFL